MGALQKTAKPGADERAVLAPRKKRLLRVGLMLSALILIVLVVKGGVGSHREPAYKGKSLTFWLDLYTPRMGRTPVNDIGKANEAVRAIGTNSIPTLLRMLRARDTSLKLKQAKFLDSLAQDRLWPKGIGNALIRMRPVLSAEQHCQAELGLYALGPDARCAVPSVIEIYEARISPSSERWAALALGAIGGEEAFFALLRGTTNSNPQSRQYSLVALPAAHVEPELTVFALTNAFADPDVEVRLSACGRFGLVGSEAFEARTRALPALQLLLQDPNPDVRRVAAAVLKEIEQIRNAKQ